MQPSRPEHNGARNPNFYFSPIKQNANGKVVEQGKMISNNSKPNVKATWSVLETKQLTELCQSHIQNNPDKHFPWKDFADKFLGRTPLQCKKKWGTLLPLSIWTPSENEKLIRAILSQQSEVNWEEIAKQLPGRTGSHCKFHWSKIRNLEIAHSSWTPEEDAILEKAMFEDRNDWDKIKKKLPGKNSEICKAHGAYLEQMKINQFSGVIHINNKEKNNDQIKIKICYSISDTNKNPENFVSDTKQNFCNDNNNASTPNVVGDKNLLQRDENNNNNPSNSVDDGDNNFLQNGKNGFHKHELTGNVFSVEQFFDFNYFNYDLTQEAEEDNKLVKKIKFTPSNQETRSV